MKLIANINWFIDMYYYWRRLDKRRKSIRYYRRHGKIKLDSTPILSVYKNAFSEYFKMVYSLFNPIKVDSSLNEAFYKELETYRRLKEKNNER